MLEKSNTSISSVLVAFNAYDLDVGLLVPTATGMAKSIMDATSSVRKYLKDSGIHDYLAQGQGAESKVTKRAYFVWPDRLEETTASLYRPQTKNGDPRIWFSGLKGYARPFDLLALVVRDDTIHVVNCSSAAVLATLADKGKPLGMIAALNKRVDGPEVFELLEMIRLVSQRGFVRTMRAGDTGVGMTLETLLGISANTRRTPDYKGIEIKAKRHGKGKKTRVTLFSQAPDWKISPIGSAWNLLSEFGYVRNGKLRLNHEMNAMVHNSIGFILEVDSARDWLKQNHRDSATLSTRHVTSWEMETLRNRLSQKHPQTFWVAAKSRGSGGDEEFHYFQVEHTKSPSVRNFDALVEGGLISVDFLMSQAGPRRVRDHGYLFKINPDDFGALFPPSMKHMLE